MTRVCSDNRLPQFFFFHKVVPATMLVWKFLKVCSCCVPAGMRCHPTNLSTSSLSLRENKVPDPGP